MNKWMESVKDEQNADCFLWHGGPGAAQISSQRHQNEADCLQNGSAVTSRWCLSGAASQMIYSTWFLHLNNVPCLVASSIGKFPSTLLVRFVPLRVPSLPQAVDHPTGEMISRLHRDTAKCNMATAGHVKTSLTRDTLKSWRIAGITAYNLEDPTLKEIIQSNLKVLQFSCNRFCPGYFLSARIFSRRNTAISIDTVNTVTFLFNVLQFGICCHLKFGFYDPKSIITVQNFLYLRYFFIWCWNLHFPKETFTLM